MMSGSIPEPWPARREDENYNKKGHIYYVCCYAFVVSHKHNYSANQMPENDRNGIIFKYTDVFRWKLEILI